MRLIIILFFVVHVLNIQSANAQKKNLKRLPRYSHKNLSIIRNTIKAANYKGRIPVNRQYRYGAIGVQASSFNYYGDLSPRTVRMSTDIKFTRPGFGIFYLYKFSNRYLLETKFSYGIIQGADLTSAKDIYRESRNLSFKNQLADFSILFHFELFPTVGYYIHRPSWNPYLFLGLGITHHNPLGQVPSHDINGVPLTNAGQWVALRPLGTEGQYSKLLSTDANYGIRPYKLYQPNIPFGYGMKIRLSQDIDLKFDFCFKYYFTDYLDDVSRNYVDLGVLNSSLAKSMSYRTYELPELRSPYTYIGRDGDTYTVEAGYGSEYKTNIRGNSKRNDFVLTFSVGMNYIMGSQWLKGKSQ